MPSDAPKQTRPMALLRDELGSPAKANAFLTALKSEGYGIAAINVWRPANTAPKGERILTWDGKQMAVVRWCGCQEQWELPDTSDEWIFTHWVLLPEPPKENRRGK